VAAALALDHLFLVAAGTWPRSRLLGPNLTRLPAAADGAVAVTFDDGPDPEVTPRVLEMLDDAGARGSFFCIGRRAERHPEIVAEAARRGQRIENHTFRHRHDFSFRGPRALAREVDRAQAVLERASGRRPAFFRAPAGIRNPFLDPVLHRRRLTLASWTRRGLDAVDPDPRRVLRRLLRGLAGGDVLLLHDGHAARDRQGRPVVLEVLPPLLDALAERGLRAVPLPDPA
jgi:peptidoglycan/xylan/chitin deacetylase (PgdA/CDA1 family)